MLKPGSGGLPRPGQGLPDVIAFMIYFRGNERQLPVSSASPLTRRFEMVAQREPQYMTVEEWRELERTTPDANLYRACLTIQEYVLIATKYQAVEVQRRADDDWTLHLFGPDDEIELASLGIRFPLTILYRGTTVPGILNGQDEPPL